MGKLDHYLYTVGLCLVQGIGVQMGRRLIDEFGSAEAVFKLSAAELVKIPKITQSIAQQIVDGLVLKKAEAELEFIKRVGADLLFYKDAGYPERLKECADGPILLLKRGLADLNPAKSISIVGSRKSTAYGTAFVKQLCKDLCGSDVVVISGLALGVDSHAHRFSMENDLVTVAVLGHGFDIIYPASHNTLAQQILSHNGALLTEFFLHSPKDKSNFIRRNRIIAGLSDAVIVVESDLKGGSLNTARYGNDYNRDVFAVPGNIGRVESRGCNDLIKTNRACMIESAKDLEHSLSLSHNGTKRAVQKELFVDYSADEQAVINCLADLSNLQFDDLARRVKWPVHKLSSVLFSLEMKNSLTILPGKRYALVK